jgi:starch synthase (maltosyl-transferring)
MEPLGNDHWIAAFPAERIGRYVFTLEAWIDPFGTWRRDMRKRIDAGQDVAVDLLIGADLLDAAGARARGPDRRRITGASAAVRDAADPLSAIRLALDDDLADVVAAHPDLETATRHPVEFEVVVDPARARFSAWYELFPRSAGPAGRHGTFADVRARLPYIAELGFDVLYLPPIHPIGRLRRKGPNNAVEAGPDDPGSPWAIGSTEGGHTAIHPQLGSEADLVRLIEAARARGIELALDIAFQAAPDHPWVGEHPSWFRHRPDGTVQYAENPPKKYQDIYPFDFDSPDWRALWKELEEVFRHWIHVGVRTFRVDNPHTKPFAFWEWLITRIKRDYPDVVFLSEAFTRPRVMERLAKLGFTQSYTYFAWRNEKWEIEAYMQELTQTDVADYFRPNFWPNTPDILTEFLQTGGRPAFMIRHVLAATLSANYGIYGPAFELLEHQAREPGGEEYLHSEKYEIRDWELERPDSLRSFIARVNTIRRAHPALQLDRTLRFHRTDNERLIAYSKHSPWSPPRPPAARRDPPADLVLTVVNLDPHSTQSGWVEVPIHEWGIADDDAFEVEDLLGGSTYRWQGAWNYVHLDPHVVPAHILHVRPPA